MCHELKKPITESQRLDFIVKYNHGQGLMIEDTDMFLFALEPNEIMGEKEIEIDVPDYETVTEEQEYDVLDFETIEEEYQCQIFDEEGNPVLDEEGNPTYEIKTREVQKPVMIEIEETDEEGNTITCQVQASHKETKTVTHEEQVGTHKETIIIPYPVPDPDYDAKQLAKAKERKHAENLTKAKQFIEDGYVEFKNAKFETNSQTVGDLTATMLLMQATGIDTYTWLSLDDKAVELTVEDFVTLGGLIAQRKNNVWNNEYLAYEELIENADTAEKVNSIEITYQ